jgi:hypothetical protein
MKTIEKNILSGPYTEDTSVFEQEFAKFGYVELPGFLKASVFEDIKREVIRPRKILKRT